MSTPDQPNRRIPKPLWVFGAATGIALLFATQTFVLVNAYPDNSITFAKAAYPALTNWYLWALFVPLSFWSLRHLPLNAGAWRRNLAFHIGIALLVAAAKFGLDQLAGSTLPWIPARPVSLTRFIFQFYPNVLTYLVITMVVHAVEMTRRERARQLRASQLEAKLAQVELQVLRMQLHPHFLFNTLNSVTALMHKDVDAAERMLVRLGDLLRLTIDRIGTAEVSVEEEFAVLESYLEIQKIRFRDRLLVELDVQPEAMAGRIPHLILQPLVENSIQYGVEGRNEPVHISVRAMRDNGTLRLSVCDDGPGLSEPEPEPEGVGLSNTRARLEGLYGAEHEFRLGPGPDGGLLVEFSIPFDGAESDE